MAKKIWKKLILEKEGNAPLYLLVAGAGMLLGLFILFFNQDSSRYEIKKLNNSPWQYVSQHPNNQFQVYFGKSQNQPVVEFRSGKNTLALAPQVQAQDWEKETVSGQDTLTIKNAYPDADIVYQIKENGLKEEIILKKKPAQKRFAFSFPSSRAIARLTLDDNWHFYESEDAPAPFAQIPKLVMKDAAGVESFEVNLHHLIKDGQEYFEIEPSEAWLADPERVYPVTLDPSLEIPPENNEIIEERDLYSKLYDKPGPGHTFVGFIAPIHYQDQSDNWQNIDIIFRSSADPQYYFSVTRHNFKVFFKKNLTQNHYLKTQFKELTLFQTIEKNQPGLGPINTSSQAHVDNNTLTYPNIYPNIDLRYTLTPSQIKEEYIIKNAKAAKKISQLISHISIQGGTLEKDKNQTLTFSNNHKILLKSPPAVMSETHKLLETTEENYISSSQGIIYQVEEIEKNQYRLIKELTDQGQNWLRASDRIFPINLDPATLNPQVSETGDDANDTGNTGQCYLNGIGDDGKIRVGDGGNSHWSGGFRFQSVNVPADITVTDSYMDIYGDGVSGTGTVVSRVYANLVSSCAAWSGTDCVTDANRTTNYSANWTMLNSYTWYQSGAFNAALEEVISTSNSWSANNNLCTMIIWVSSGDPNYARIKDYGANSTQAAKISFTYNTPTPTLPPYATDTPAPPGPFKFEGLKMEGVKID